MRIRTSIFSRAATVAALLAVHTASAHPPGPTGDHGHAAREHDGRAALRERVERTPNDARAWLALGHAELRAARRSGDHHDLHAAEDAFTHLLDLAPDSVEAYRGLAYARLGQHRFDAAYDAARAVADRQPTCAATWSLLGDVHLALGNLEEADAVIRRLAETELTLASLSRSAMVAELRGRVSEADALYHDALDAGALLGVSAADRAWLHTVIGEFDLGAGAWDDACAHFDAALALDPTARTATRLRAITWAWQGRLEDAAHELEHLASRDGHAATRLALARVHHRRGVPQRAADELESALAPLVHEVMSGDVGHARELVTAWNATGGPSARALELARADLALRQDAGAYETLAWSLHRAGMSDEARPLIDTALRRDRSSARIMWRAAQIYAALGRAVESELLEARAVDRNPRIEVVMEWEMCLHGRGSEHAAHAD